MSATALCSDGFTSTLMSEHDPAYLSMIAFLRAFIPLREQDGGFMPFCSCGSDIGKGGAILLQDGEWNVHCALCLSHVPADERMAYSVDEVQCLLLTKYGRKVQKTEVDGGHTVSWT